MNRCTPRSSTIRRFALHPLSMALALSSLSTAAWASPFTGLQSTQNVTIHDRGQGATDVLQSAQVGIIRTQGFGIGAHESLRALQPNAQSSLLIDVLGPVRTDILGSLTANGRILISNPYGVYFGAGAQINVGSLVATTLGVNSDDLLTGRIRLKDNGQTIGSVINAGQISATGTVALVGPQVSNEGHITASRVGLAATSEVLVDVEGDGLIFFQMSGEKAGQRLSQLGQITADGGVVDLRANARGTMADTVLNMDGLIQARSIGSRQGQVFIDGGAQGRTAVHGQIDASGQGAGEQGGQVTVLGQHVALGSQAHIDTRGQAGGGSILVGGNYQGGGTERRAETTWVAAGARLDASAIQAGHGGQVVVWSDDLTVFDGHITSRGGLEGGNGGELEVSGLQRLSIGAPAHFDALAPKGLVGNLLLDPQDIFIVASGGGSISAANSANSTTDASINASTINAVAANLTLSASRDIVVSAPIAMTNAGVSLRLNADRDITVNGSITTNGGSVTLDADRNITVNQSITTNNGDITLTALNVATLQNLTLGANLNAGAGDVALTGLLVLSGASDAASTVAVSGDDIALSGSIDGDGLQTRSLSVVGSGGVTLGGTFTNDIGNTNPIGDLSIRGTSLTVNSGTITPVAGSKFTLVSATPGNQIAIRTSAGAVSNSLVIRTGTLDKFSAFASINLGQGTGLTRLFDDYTAPTHLNFKDSVQLDDNITLIGGGRNITFESTLVGQSKQLIINDAGVITLKGNATGLDDFKVTQSAPGTSTTTLENGITISAADELLIQGNVTLANPVAGTQTYTLRGNSVSLTHDVAAQDNSLTIRANTLSLGGMLSGTSATAQASISTLSNDRGISLATTAANTLELSQTLLTQFSAFSQLTIGRADSNSAITALALTLGNDLTLTSGTAAINLASVTGAGFDLSLNSTGTTTLGGAITGVDALTTNAGGTTAINANVSATTQTYNDGITLGGTAGEARTLSGTSIDIKSGVAAGSHNLTLEADTLAVAGSSTADAGVGVTLRTQTADRTIGLAGGAGDTSISQATLNALGGASGFRSITVGAGNGAIVANALGLSTALILNAGTADITLAGITGAGFDLSLNSIGTTLLGGTVTGVGALTTNSGGTTTISADITTTGAQQYNDNVTIGGTGTRTLSASALSLNGTLNVDGRSIALLADTLSMSNNVTGAGAGQTATLATQTADKSIGLAGGAGDLALSQALLSRFNSFGNLTVGRANSNSAITAGALQLGTHTTLVGGAAAINLAAITGNNFDLTVNTSGVTSLSGTITGIDDLITDATGSTRVGANISSATQTYNDNVVLENAGTRTLTANTLTVQQGLSAGTTGLSLVVDNLSVSGSVTASNGNTLSIDKRNAGGIALAQVNAGDLQISQSTLNALGGTSGFDTLRIGSVGNNRAITTGALTLASDLILTANTANISLGALTGAGHDLQAQTSGQITLGGNVSGVADLTLSGASGINISAASIRTTGTQTYQQAVQFTGTDTTLRTLEASTLSFSGAVQANNHDLTLKADTFVFGGAASIQGSPGFGGTQTLTIATQTASRTIGLSGGAGDLQLPLDQVQDFDRLVVGDSSGTGQITVGLSGGGANIDFGDVTITSGTGNIVIDAAMGSDMFPLSNLTLSTGGITRVNGVEIYADNLVFNGAVVLGQNLDSLSYTTTVRGNQLVFNGSVDGDVAGAAVLDTMDVNLTRFEGAVGSTQSLQEILTNDVELGSSITASSLIQFSGNVSLFDDTSLTAPTINLGGGASTLNASDVNGDYSLALRSDTLNTLLGPINGGNELTLAPLDNARAIVVGNGLGLGQLVIDSATLARFSGFQQITVGSATLGTGDITIGDGFFTDLVLPTSLRAQSLSGDITVSQAISGNHNLSLSTSGQIRIERDLGGTSGLTALSSLSVEGNATLALSGNQTLRTSGSQTYTGAVNLGSNANLIGASVRLQGSVDGARSLNITTTGNTRLDGEVGGGTRLTQLSINAASIDLHDGSVNTTGNQAYAGTTTLHTDTTLSSLGGQVALNGAVQGVSNGGQALVIAAPQAIISQSVGTTGTRLKSLTTTGALNLAGGQVFTTGAQQYQGVTTLQANTTLTSTAGDVIFSNALDADSSGTRSLAINTSGITRFTGAVGASVALASLTTDAAGSTELGQGARTTGAQTYNDHVTLTGAAGPRTLQGSALNFNGDLSAGAHSIQWRTDSLSVAGNLTANAGMTATIAPLTDGLAINLGGAGGLALSNTLLAKLSVFDLLTVGRSDSNSTITASALSLPTALRLISSTGNITLAAVTGGGFDLSINSGGLSTFGGAVSGVANLDTDAVGNTQIDADITTTGAQAYLDSVTLGGTGTRSFTGTGLTFTGSTLSASTHGLRLVTDTLTLTSALSTNGTQAAVVATYSDGRNIVLGGAGGAGDLTLDATTLSRFNGFTQLTVGRSDSNSAITGTAVVLPTDLTLISGSANQTLSGLTGAGFDLDLRSSGTSTLQGAIAGLSTLQTDAAGRTELNATVSTTGAQTYRDAVDVAGTSTLSSSSGADLTFNSTIDGKTNGTGSLALNTAGVTRLNGAVGQSRRLASLSTDASGSTVLSADLATTGAIALQDAVTLAQSLTITHGGLSFGNTLNGAVDLNLVGSTTTSLLGTVGGTTALSSLTSTGGGQTTLGAGNTGITTTGALSLSGAVLLSGVGQQLTATDLNVGGNLSGANGLTLTSNTLAIGGTLTGTGALLIKPLDLSTTLGVGDGANATGTLRVTQAMLSSASGFTSVTLGDAAGTGDINVGTAVLGTHTTLQTPSGDLTLHDAINSAGTGFYDLNLHSGGTTTVLGALGVGRALRNVITDDNLSAANRSDGLPGGEHTRFEAVNDGGQATIVATERIVFNDPVTSSVDTRWQAGTQVLAESTGNRLSQTVSINTAQVSLFNATNLQLGEVRLTGSLDSDIVTDGVMTLTDNVNLSAGSLLLQANATPTTLADFTSPEFAGKVLTVGLSAALGEASLGLSQTGGTITTAANALLAVRTPGGASISLMQSGNDLAGAVSAVSGRIGESLTSLRPLTPIDGKVRAGFLRIQSRQLNVAGRPVDDSDQSLLRAGLEADVIELNLDGLNTALNNGLVRARLPYDNNQGSLTAMPALTINVSALGLNTLKAFGGVETASRIAVSVGNSTGGFVTVKPKNGASLGPGYVSLGGDKDAKPFYDGSGKITEVPVFYNGDVPQSPQAVGALSAVTAVIEEARRARFEEAVRTENVSARLRSGVIAEVGSGRPATEGSDSIRMPDTCSPKANSLGC